MGKRLLKLVIFILVAFTLPLTIIPSALIWVVTGRFYLDDIGEWIING